MKHYVVSNNEAKEFLNAHLQSDISDVELLNGGEWSAAFAYIFKSKEYVIRFAASKQDFEKDQQISRFSSPKLRLPKVVEVGEALRGYFAISERNHGVFLDDLDGNQMQRALLSLLQVLDEVRAIDLSSTKGYGWWEAKGLATAKTWQEALMSSLHDDDPNDRNHGWRQKLDGSKTGADSFDIILGVFKELAAEMPSARYLVHGDLLSRNTLVSHDKIEVIIDWGNSMYGDFLYDIAWLVYWWPWYPKWKDIDIQRAIYEHYSRISLSVPDLEKRLLCYQIHIGLDAQKYNAFTGRWDELAQNTQQTLELVKKV